MMDPTPHDTSMVDSGSLFAPASAANISTVDPTGTGRAISTSLPSFSRAASSGTLVKLPPDDDVKLHDLPPLAPAPPNPATINANDATGDGMGNAAAQSGSGGAGGGSGAVKRRSPIACRRCRRLRSKCRHVKQQPPCEACKEAGVPASECEFLDRGVPDLDRQHRHPRLKQERKKKDMNQVRRDIMTAAGASVPREPSRPGDDPTKPPWNLLPPKEEIIRSVEKFTRYYFQLGFIHKPMFLEQLNQDLYSASPFLLLSILSVSARFLPCLVERYGNAVDAAQVFMDRASRMAQDELYLEPPTLERCQAYYLLSVAQQGSGLRQKSSTNMGIAVRMATLMGLHREETYALDVPTPAWVAKAESARRTLWMLHSQDNLHSSTKSPVSLHASDITALLPCSEDDFLHGREPRSRAALAGTQPAIDNPALVCAEGRSLFAALIQVHNLWGSVSRRALSQDKSLSPWNEQSEYALLAGRLKAWEEGLKPEHRWTPERFLERKRAGQELAFLTVTMTTRLSNIVLRKSYLGDMLSFEPGKASAEIAHCWTGMARELCRNVKELHDQIDIHYKNRVPDDGVGAQMATFCVYTCGFMASYICKCPTLCADERLRAEGPRMVDRMLTVLNECKAVWPLATRWYDHLLQFHNDKKVRPGVEGSMADSRVPIPNILRPGPDQSVAMNSIQSRRAGRPPALSFSNPIVPGNQKMTLLSPAKLPPPPPDPNSTKHIDPSLRLPLPGSGRQTPVAMSPPHASPTMPMFHKTTPTEISHPAIHSQPNVSNLHNLINTIRPHPPTPNQVLVPDPSQQVAHPDGAFIQLPSASGVGGDSLGLLVEAGARGGANGGVNGDIHPLMTLQPPPQHTPIFALEPVASLLAAAQAHQHHDSAVAGAEYYSNAALVDNDGYENELNFYMEDTMQVMPSWGQQVQVMYPSY